MAEEIRKNEAGQAELLLSVRNLKKYYPIANSAILPQNRKAVHAVDGVDLDLYRGETLGLVGESGCGKSTVGRLLVGIEKPTEGSVIYRGQDLVAMKRKDLAGIRTELQMVFQDAFSSLNPRKRVFELLADPMLYHRLCRKDEAEKRVLELLEMVGLPQSAMQRYPHEFSGGQRQRISIAKALSLKPEILVCDEPVSALDVSIQAQILNLLKDLQRDLGISYLFIAHGLGAVNYISRRTAVMYLGKIVEEGESGEIFRNPLHPYARLLIAAVPEADPEQRDESVSLIEGEVPSAVDLPKGCRFAARCPYASEHCRKEEPSLVNAAVPGESRHLVACWHVSSQRG
ncbi:MAG: ABC transporter ATP-binding protein [Lachnospiraceae bacterium]|nr:ABC transporter ATP-binding protein [Lachnospiraceae bacterium]